MNIGAKKEKLVEKFYDHYQVIMYGVLIIFNLVTFSQRWQQENSGVYLTVCIWMAQVGMFSWLSTKKDKVIRATTDQSFKLLQSLEQTHEANKRLSELILQLDKSVLEKHGWKVTDVDNPSKH